jgi:pimeloyl-ACP methyl ester carboxylesterase
MTEMDPLGYETGSPPLQRVMVGGKAMTFRESGHENEPVIVLLHGVGSLGASWGPQFVSLPSRGMRVIGWDAPGYGGSDPLPSPEPAPEDYARALLGLVETLGLKRFDLVGHSMGTLPAAAFCRITGAKYVRKLVLAAPTPGYAHASEEALRRAVDSRLEDMASLGPAGMAEKRAPGLLSAQAPRRAHMLVRAAMKEMRQDGYAAAVRMIGRGDTIAEGRGIAVPILVMVGSNDTTTPPENCKRIADALGARFEVIAGPAHALYIEAPGPFDDALISFLESP